MVIPCMKYFLEKKMQLQKKNLFFPQEVTNNLLFIKCKTFLDLLDFLVSNLVLIPFSNRRRVNVFLRLSLRLSTISEICEPVLFLASFLFLYTFYILESIISNSINIFKCIRSIQTFWKGSFIFILFYFFRSIIITKIKFKIKLITIAVTFTF